MKKIDDVLCEPMEHVIIDVPEEFVGIVIEKLGKRKAEMKNMITFNDNTRIEFIIPSRGLIGYRAEFMTDTKEQEYFIIIFMVMNHLKEKLLIDKEVRLLQWKPVLHPLMRCLSCRNDLYFLLNHGTKVYEGMVVGENSRNNDMHVNVTKTKQLTNMRSSGADEAIRLEPPTIITLEQAIEWITDDEFVEVTPHNIRIRKEISDRNG